jgi:ankyrin repeat protein
MTGHRLLLNAGADANSSDCRGYRPVHMVAKSANEEILTLLLENGATLNVLSEEKYLGKSPLHRARCHGNARSQSYDF